ncbi:MAG: hypothetical protein NZ518_09490, partial [Dehalococcoidia bacterium]|nr:hypothetical protein [Dehalococcoidia bacterium]
VAYPLFATQLVGSYHKPRWLYNREGLLNQQLDKVWVPAPEHLREAQDDAVRLAILDQTRAGLDIITDGEQRRESFANYFYRFGGIDPVEKVSSQPDRAPDMDLSFVTPQSNVQRAAENRPPTIPKVTGPLSWSGPIALDDLRFLQAHTDKLTKMTVIGPITASSRIADGYYGNPRDFALAMADVINQELRALDAAGVDLLQIDEPDVHFLRKRTNAFVAEVINRAIAGVKATTVIHICYGYSIVMKNKRVDTNFGSVLEAVAESDIDVINLEYAEPGHDPSILRHCGTKIVMPGVLNLGNEQVETADQIAAMIRAMLTHVPPERVMLAPDCGMWFLPRAVAFGKIRAMALGAEIVRAELEGRAAAV